ncbi:MAG: hypothetical protein M0Q54_03990 [Pigmentiphaga sp.]|nr:hypothetical protein [Pigmentiphaga sp.]
MLKKFLFSFSKGLENINSGLTEINRSLTIENKKQETTQNLRQAIYTESFFLEELKKIIESEIEIESMPEEKRKKFEEVRKELRAKVDRYKTTSPVELIQWKAIRMPPPVQDEDMQRRVLAYCEEKLLERRRNILELRTKCSMDPRFAKRLAFYLEKTNYPYIDEILPNY